MTCAEFMAPTGLLCTGAGQVSVPRTRVTASDQRLRRGPTSTVMVRSPRSRIPAVAF